MKTVRTFAQLGMNDVAVVGGKNASLGEMFNHLRAVGVRVPDGFATTAQAFRDFLAHNQLAGRIQVLLDSLDVTDVTALSQAGQSIRDWVMQASLQPELQADILQAYRELSADSGGRS